MTCKVWKRVVLLESTRARHTHVHRSLDSEPSLLALVLTRKCGADTKGRQVPRQTSLHHWPSSLLVLPPLFSHT